MVDNNFIIHQQAFQYQWSGECFLSLKSFYRGTARYQVGTREYFIDGRSYLLLNECTRYHLTIDTTTPTESFCVFFSPSFVAGVVSEWAATDEQRLDFLVKPVSGLRLMERTYLHQGSVSQWLLMGRKSQISNSTSLAKEEFYHELLQTVLFQSTSEIREMDKLTFKKKATREEIYRRVHYARDFMDGCYTQNLRLNQIAQVAMMSENHLLRSFRRVFGTTPFRYIQYKKLAQAKREILTTSKSISSVAADAGYESLSNFSYCFSNAFGCSPSGLRKKVIGRK